MTGVSQPIFFELKSHVIANLGVVFSMKDFNGFKDIGKGGKKGDPTSTGMFGRGALTMYHFTDVPMLISNESFVVLDPQQQILPVDRTRRKRRVGMRMPLSKVNRLAPDQLDPFVGLQGFNRDADKYHGTLFRFPLRALGAKTTLKETDYGMDMASVRSLLTEFLATARTALLFLQHVKSIEFHIRGQQNPQWGVSARCFPDTVNDTFRRTEITTSQIGSNQHLDIWCVGLETITQMTPSTARSGRGSGKMTECGVAACLVEGQLRKAKREEPVPSSYQPKSTVSKLAQQPAIQQKVFCRLPTTHKSSLPVSFHASFAVTGDRRSISLEASAENSEWNRWLLKDRTAELYLDTVQYLAPRLGQDAFNFWPVYGETTTLSNILARAFWERLVDQHRPALLPLVTRDNRPKKNTGAALFGLTEKATSLAAGTLDLLPTPTSEGLLPLLTQTVPLLALVRPPAKLRLLFRTPPLVRQIQELDVECLSSVFRAEENCKLLELLMASSEDEKEQVGMVRSLLKTMIPVARGEDTAALELLDRCRIVPRPRLGDRMGTLIWKPSPGATEHLVATLKEQELFAFGADSMVNTSLFTRRSDALAIDIVDHDPVKILLNFGFNLRPLELSDLGPLLARPDSPTATAAVNYSQNLDIWLPEFWRYLNIHLYAIHNLVDYSVTCSDKAIHTLLSKYGLQDKYIYRKYADQRWVYLTPSEFEAGACLMQPVDERHRQICGEIPGLSMIDHNCAPYFLKEQERDLNCGKSFKRLLLAVEKLEKSRKAVAKTFMGLALTSKSKDLMKDLALDYLNSFDFEGLNDNAVLGRLPVWRRLESSTSSPNDHIAAEDGRFCAFRKMLMPWVQDLSRFVVPEMVDSLGSALSRLGISPMTHQQIWDEIKGDLPSVIKSNEFRQYSDFIDFIARWDIKVSGKLAPNGASVMCITNCLYDDQDEIFKAAFRQQQPTRFLHPEMRKPALRKFWLEQGLRVRSSGVMVEEHFLECALAINRRWDPGFTTPNFEEDSKTVAAYLKYDNRHFRSWFSHNWLRLASIPMFKVRNIAAEESNHRVTRMQQIAQERTHRALEESSNMNHKRIVWSQTAFLQEQPGEFVYDVLPRGGKPTAVQVFDHLGFLVASIKDVEQADLPEYLRDVQDCYEFLQDEIGATKHIPGIQRARIWLNLDSTQVEKAYKDHLEINLTSADVLCLNSPVVSLPLQRVRKFLVPYEKLLQGLGSQTIVQPSSTSEPQSSDSRELSLATAMSKMRGLRDQNQLVDVYFEAAGQKAPAHKIVLAAVSEYCEKQFAGHWGRVLESQATVHVEDLRFLTLSQMIDFAYTGDFEWPELKLQDDATEVEETLAMLLDLLDGTDRWLLQRLHDMTDNFLTSQPYSSFYIRVDTVEWAKERAEGSRASKLVKYCEEFLTDNEGPMEAWRRGVEAEG